MTTTHRTQCPTEHGYEVVLLMGNITVGSGTEEEAHDLYQRADPTMEPLIIANHVGGGECHPEMTRQYEWAHYSDSVFVGWRTRDEQHDRGGSPLRITERVINGNTYRFIGSVSGRYITCIVHLMRGKVPFREVHHVKIRRLKRYMFTGPRRNFQEYVTKNGVLIRSWDRVINGKTYHLHSACNGAGVAIMAYLSVGGVEIPIVNAAILREEIEK